MRDDAAIPPDGDGGPLTAETSATATEPVQSNPANASSTDTKPSAASTPAPPKVPASRGWLSSVRRPRTSPGPKASALNSSLLSEDDARRDSALASSNSTASTDRAAHNNAPPSPTSLHKTPSLPTIVVQDVPSAQTGTSTSYSVSAHDLRTESFQTIDTIIPTGDFDDLTSPGQVSFSKRGSMLLGGKRANKMNKALGLVVEGEKAPRAQAEKGQALDQEKEQEKEKEQAQKQQAQDEKTTSNEQEKEQTPEQTELTTPVVPLPTPRSPSRFSSRRSVNQRVLSTDEMMLSRKVLSMYKHGNESAADWDDADTEGGSVKDSVATSSVVNTPMNASSLTVDRAQEDSVSLRSSRRTLSIVKETTEAAGGVEDWADLEGNEVDRYGFIVPKKTGSRDSTTDGPEEPRIQRVTTALLLVSEEPRRRGLGRSTSRARSSRSAGPRSRSPKTQKSVKSSRGPRSIFSSNTTTTRSTAQQPLRQAANLLPHNRDRRLLDEASDMLKLPPGLAEVAEQQEGGNTARIMKAKELEREMKWRKMAKVVRSGANTGGMLFEFDIKDPKVISRTWKGIPDRWRATAWYSFLAASAEKTEGSPTEQELIESFYELQEENSADDMQIDVDVPRTINRHIMFRRRYRGGQRLLFRVLHAMSLYLPDTGYVQGMAALAATLLCYYEEDKAFVVLVRLWMLRGLERLYQSGFEGLMDALDDFEKNWLRGGDIAKKLDELGITSTSYGTRWYLTLFNYSLPFPAQLRVWDVFMLLGDASHSTAASPKFVGDLDVLHATSAALIDATREILLDSDFENAMKVLTSWIPVKDEDLLMRVAKAEYKMRKKRANAA